MTVNELIGKIEARIKELGKLKTVGLRLEHPDSNDGDYRTQSGSSYQAKMATRGKNREDIIAEIIAEEFSYEYDMEI